MSDERPGLRPYAANPLRAGLQALADVLVVAWVIGWVLIGRAVHDAIAAIAVVGQKVQEGATGISGNLDHAGDEVGRLPLVGEAVQAPLRAAGRAARDLAGAGQGLDQRATQLALLLALAVAVPPIAGVVVPWLVLRLRFARRAAATAALARTPSGQRLLALRALASRPLPELMATAADPVEAWYRGDPAAVSRLAAIEQRAAGLRAPDPGAGRRADTVPLGVEVSRPGRGPARG